MDGTWVHTLEDGLDPVSLSNRPPVPAPKPPRLQSVRLVSLGGGPTNHKVQQQQQQDQVPPPRRNSAFYGIQDHALYTEPPEASEGAKPVALGDLSLVDPHNKLQKLEHVLSDHPPEPATKETTEPSDVLDLSANPMLRTEALVRECNWEQFKNRYPDEREMYAVELLLAQDDLVEQIEADQVQRLKPEQRKSLEQNRRKARQPRGRRRVENPPIERVRINSAIVLGYLSRVTGEGPWVDRSHTFLAPFNLFLHFHEKMDQELRVLAGLFGDRNAEPRIEPIDDDSFAFLGDKELQGMMRSRKAYADMKCYVDFVEARLLSRRNMFPEVDCARPPKVSYRDLASLFRPGDLVVEPGVSQAESKIMNKRSSSVQVIEPKLWRVCYISEDTPTWFVHNLDAPGGELQGQITTADEATHLRLYYIDFDGQRFSPVKGDVSVDFFEGEKEVTKLPVYPLRFHKDHQSFLTNLQERGRRFRDIVCSGNPTLSYQGWTLTKDPVGRDIVAKPGQNTTWPEYVESDVIVDFSEAFQVYPWWKPAFHQFPEPEAFYPTTVRDEYRIIEWADKSRSNEFASREEMVVEYDGVRELEWESFAENDPFISQPAESDSLGHLSQTLSEDDLALLPGRLFVYALRSRAFVNADIRYVKARSDTLNPLDSLQLPEKHKVMIQSAVVGHLEKKKLRRRATLLNSEFLEQDVIHGKGRGLAVLLHGPPGVGKTATAEAIAHYYKKPLFPITSSDLGSDPWDVEAKLTEIFRLANLWDCILLLDEAETLLTQREKKDNNLQKSSLVSVFLRTLEYYSGILFLTTNRPDVMDDAVKSRVQVSLQYPRLGLIETLAIFQTNIDRLIDIEFERAKITGQPGLDVKSDGILAFAAAHYHRHEGNAASPPWNGRQIRNAFQIAPSIARYAQSSGDSSSYSYIGPEHFEKVEESATESEPRYPMTAGDRDRDRDRDRGRQSESETSRASPNRQSAFTRRGGGIRTSNRFSGDIQRIIAASTSGDAHKRQRSSSSVVPLYLPQTQAHMREPSPPTTPSTDAGTLP
ncbi:hypothetical protein GGR50DRAFT_656173 [Xylaria sp. CBS 124048]|nr:hypothetical protein GGR50DRAFT_656173 [Xylaria sp. CBS 124048]